MTFLFSFLVGFGGDSGLDFAFPSNFTASASNMVGFSLVVLLNLSRSLVVLYSYRLAGNNSLIDFDIKF